MSTIDAGAPAAAAAPADRRGASDPPAVGPTVRLPPYLPRLLAFTIDLLLCGAAAGTAVELPGLATGSASFDTRRFLPVLALTVVTYHTAMVWLTRGQTAGKALCSLSIRRADGRPLSRTPADLAWAFGRSAGYVFVDVFGIGSLVAFGNPRRRCPHDYAFRSEVVALVDAPGQSTGPVERLHAFARRHAAAVEETNGQYGLLLGLWKWLLRIAVSSLAGLMVLGRWAKKAAAASPTGSAASGAAGSTAATTASAVLVAGTTAATVAVAVAAAGALAPAPTAELTGTWGNLRIEQVAGAAYQGIELADYTGDNGCTFRAGTILERIHGRAPSYTGETLWSYGDNGQNCVYGWGSSTFTLDRADNVLRICSTDPFPGKQGTCLTEVRRPTR